MSELAKQPTHYRLLSKLKAIGPYLREPQSDQDLYYFDCLSVCVDDKQSPEKREFYGWWMELEPVDNGFSTNYHVGKYDAEGDWQVEKLPKKTLQEVNRNQAIFHEKLCNMLVEEFELEVCYHPDSAKFV